MSTWHTDEPLEQVLRFALDWTDFDNYVFRDFLSSSPAGSPYNGNRSG